MLLPFILLFLLSCAEEDKSEVVDIRVNHFKQPAVGLGTTLALLVQEGDQIGSNEWDNLYGEINGFDFEWGFIYDLRVRKIPVDSPPQDASSIAYSLIEVISKTPVSGSESFDLELKSSMKGIEGLVIVNKEAQSTLLGQQVIDCQHLCQQLEASLLVEEELRGTFVHGEGAIILQELIF